MRHGHLIDQATICKAISIPLSAVRIQGLKADNQSYIWGGLSVSPPIVNVTAFNDVYVLTLPTFQWAKIFPGHQGNATYDYGHYSASCNMVKSLSQMMVIGGSYPGSDMCDLAPDIWAQHNLWTGGVNNTGQPPQDIYWALYNPNVSSNVVPVDVYNLVGGDEHGGATLLTPKNGYDSGNNTGTGLAALLERKPNFPNRTATRSIPCTQSCQPTNSTTPTSSPMPKSPSPRHLSTGAIVGIAIAGAVVLGLILCGCWLVGKRVQQRRQLQRQSPAHNGDPSSTVGDYDTAQKHSVVGSPRSASALGSSSIHSPGQTDSFRHSSPYSTPPPVQPVYPYYYPDPGQPPMQYHPLPGQPIYPAYGQSPNPYYPPPDAIRPNPVRIDPHEMPTVRSPEVTEIIHSQND
jgi:hypothetical protein